jgi:hypothetical protein
VRMGKRRAWLLGLVLALLAPVAAQAAEDGLFPLDYQAPPGCPDRQAFETRVRARLPHRGTVAGAGRLEVRITMQASIAAGELAMLRDGERTVRRLEAPSCAEAVDALALIAALMLDPSAASEHGAASHKPDASEHSAPASANQPDRPPAPAGQARAAVAAPAPRPEQPARAPAAASPISLAAPSVPPRSSLGASEEAPRAARPSQPPPWSFLLHASALLAAGVAPNPSWGAALGARLATTRAQRLELAAALGARLVQMYRSERAQGEVHLGWWSGSAGLCAGARLGARAALVGCLEGELGQLRARGERTRQPASSQRLWAALGPATLVRWRVLGPVSLQAGLSGLFPFARHRYVLADQTVHSVPALTFRVELGVAVQIQ